MPAHRLSSIERSELGGLASVLDCGRVRLYRCDISGGARLVRKAVLWLSRNRAIALGNHVFLPDRYQADLPVLAHELTHCIQYQNWGPWRYYTRGAAAQLKSWLHSRFGIGTNPYWYHADPGRSFESYGMEQQGQIVEDCFRGVPTARALAPFQPGRKS